MCPRIWACGSRIICGFEALLTVLGGGFAAACAAVKFNASPIGPEPLTVRRVPGRARFAHGPFDRDRIIAGSTKPGLGSFGNVSLPPNIVILGGGTAAWPCA